MKYELLALDLDGTLTNSKKEVTPHTLETLFAAQQLGVKVALVSGRPTYGVAPIAEQLCLEKYGGYVVSFNGGEVTDWRSKKTLYKRYVDPAFLPYLKETAKKNGFALMSYDGDHIVTESPYNEYVLKASRLNKMKICPVDDFVKALTQPVSKCLIVGYPGTLAELEMSMSRELEEDLGVFRSEPYFLEIVPDGVDKEKALSSLVSYMGITKDQVIAIGDGYNDLTMIVYAGLGIAMANAQAPVKNSADFITLSNEEDGVAYAIEKFILS